MARTRHRAPNQTKQPTLTDRELIGRARAPAPVKYGALAHIKSQLNPGKLFSLFAQVFRTDSDIAFLHGAPFPLTPEIMFRQPRLIAAASLGNELVWAISTCIHFADRLSRFNLRRDAFEKNLLKNKQDETNFELELIQKEFGWSVWLIQNRLSVTQVWNGIDEKRRLAREYEEQASTNHLLSLLIRFISRRCEGTTVPGYLQTELGRAFTEDSGREYETYARVKLFDLGSPAIEAIPAALSIEAQSSMIDYYETLIAVLQTIAADSSVPAEFADQLDRPLIVLHRRTGDERLVPILKALSRSSRESFVLAERATVVEAYSEGRYEDVLSLGGAHVAAYPGDVSALVLMLKAAIKGELEPPSFEGILSEVAENLTKIFRLSSDTYAAAFALLTLYDRFFGHAWATYIRATVLNELAQEQEQFPAASLRRIFAIDRHITPFSELLTRKDVPATVSPTMICHFPSTSQVFSLVTSGHVGEQGDIDVYRRKKYLGRYFLATGQYDAALETFQWLYRNSKDGERVRAGACLAIALARGKDFLGAVNVIVATYLAWPNVPTILPVPALTHELESPGAWPNTIALPLLFELYGSYFKDDKLPHLRYAFEKFQTDNDLGAPEDLKEKIHDFGLEEVIMYLDRVWKPEVMRQTLLYEGTRDIEDARIKVCRLLSEIDPDNTSAYVNEIRERVKQQEIAKATNLVEQSKVYVDIGAIKKTLRSKLGDAYARYKGAVQAAPDAGETFVEQLAEILSDVRGKKESLAKVLSHSHFVTRAATSELDVQFASMFSEVTNEFLNGDHGLNAYLSTRVRHGTLSNTLRKPVADEKLITERKQNETSYVRNDYWAGELDELEADELTHVMDALDHFSGNFDSIVDFVRDRLIQIAVIHELVDSGKHPDALFVYSSSNMERKYIQEYDKNLKNISEFINRCVETLWEKTDDNLLRVQHVFSTDIRARFMHAFDALTDALVGIGAAERLGPLLNSIARARTNVQTKLVLVGSWFKRSEVYDRQDYSPDFAVLVAKNMITNTISAASGWDGVQVGCSSGSVLMPGARWTEW
jgi:tetratricopeptide (TPR) repeat protein